MLRYLRNKLEIDLILQLAPERQLIYFQVTGTGGYVTPWYKFKTGHEPDSWNILYEYLSE